MKPTDYTIITDSREQIPLNFGDHPNARGTLKTGDYSLLGYESRIAVERKSHADMWGSVAGERARFERCLARLAAMERAALVIECSLAQLCERPSYIQRVTPATAVGSVISWSCQYRLPVFFAENPAFAARVTLRFLLSFAKHLGGQAEIPEREGDYGLRTLSQHSPLTIR